ncbi:fungal-specific transcription factor domain-containing protein [Penicillium sp. IBT 35674x]|nr:fungal-specific transcription factor domain-containing protein [Penicillium sp. IBT 35674x]
MGKTLIKAAQGFATDAGAETKESKKQGILNGIRILDLSRVLAVGYPRRWKALWDIIKIEEPGKGDDTRHWRMKGEDAAWKNEAGPISNYFSAVNRNKRSVTLNLKDEKGKEILLNLARNADVLVENFRPGTMDRLGFGKRGGYDPIAAAEGGMLHITGERNGPPVRVGIGMIDMATGLYMHGAILAALQARNQTGQGQRVDASLFETQVSMLTNVGLSWLNLGIEAERWGCQHPSIAPYDAFKTKDLYLVCGATNDGQFSALCKLLGLDSLPLDKKFATNPSRVENRDALTPIFNQVFATKTTAEWMEVFDGTGLPFAPINNMQGTFSHRQTSARHMVAQVPIEAATAGVINLIDRPPDGAVEDRRASNTPTVLGDQFPVSLTFEDQIGSSQSGDVPQEECPSASAQMAPIHSFQAATNKHSQHLPVYIKPLAPHILADDIEYLAKKGALSIPDDELRNELLRLYIKLVHPSMPILDVSQFVTPIIKADGSNPVSLLLFQAVMFVSISFIDIDILRCRGYTGRKSARKRFFNRVRLLYGLDCETDRLALLQSLLFMTFWYDAPADEKDTWHWMGVSLSLAQVMGIHRNPENLKISPMAKRLRIRLWWSCFMRDKLLALGIRRPARIRPDESNVPMLTLDDFDTGPVSDEVRTLLGASALPQSTDQQRKLSLTCIELAKLCICIGHILLSQYSVVENDPVNSKYFTSVMVFPRKTDEQSNELEKCDDELSEWHGGLDPCSRYTPYVSGSSQKEEEADKIIRLHQSTLHMIYLTALGVLHRPQVVRASSNAVAGGNTKILSRQKVTDAAIQITQLAYDMQRQNQLRYLSTSSIPAFISAALIHLFEIRSTQEDVRNLSIGRFFQCVHVLHQLQEMYASADYAVYFLQSVIQKTGIQVPMLSLTYLPSSRGPGKPNTNATLLPTTLHATSSSPADPTQKRYPTPSSFDNQSALLGSPPIPSHGPGASFLAKDPAAQAMQPPAFLPLRELGEINARSHDQNGMILQEGHLHSSAQQINCDDLDSLLCSFINFESDPDFGITPIYNAND